MVKYLSNSWGSLEIPLIICDTNPILTWLSTWLITKSVSAETFTVTVKNLYVLVVALSTRNNANP